MTRRDADVGELASAFGLGALPYRSFRNPPVRRAPPTAAPAAAADGPEEEGAEAMAGEGHLSPPVLRVIADPPRERDMPAAGPAQVIAWPAAMPAPGASAPGERAPPAVLARKAPEPEPLSLLLAAVAVRGPPGPEQPALPIEYPLLAAALGLAAPRTRPEPPPSPEARRSAPAGEYPLLQAALTSGGRS